MAKINAHKTLHLSADDKNDKPCSLFKIYHQGYIM